MAAQHVNAAAPRTAHSDSPATGMSPAGEGFGMQPDTPQRQTANTHQQNPAQHRASRPLAHPSPVKLLRAVPLRRAAKLLALAQCR